MVFRNGVVRLMHCINDSIKIANSQIFWLITYTLTSYKYIKYSIENVHDLIPLLAFFKLL